jgi:hypothetical protein
VTVPTWLQHHLEQAGLWDSDGTTRAARARRCRSCRDYVIVGLDADRCALPVAVDPDPLTELGEAAALIAGRRTFALSYRTGRLELDLRTTYEIRSVRQRDSGRVDVLAEHVCGCPSIGTAAGLGQPTRLVSATPHPTAVPPF